MKTQEEKIRHAQEVHDFLETVWLHHGWRSHVHVTPERFEGTGEQLLQGLRSSLIRANLVFHKGERLDGWNEPVPTAALELLRAQVSPETGETPDRTESACSRTMRLANACELALEASRRLLRAAKGEALPRGLAAWPCADWPCSVDVAAP